MIAKRYIQSMTHSRTIPSQFMANADVSAKGPGAPDAELAADLIVHLARLARARDDRPGLEAMPRLSAAQWAALRYMARANPFSRTPSAFARYHGTTRGTASQTIKSLVSAGFLVSSRDPRDRRSVRFSLTKSGENLLADDGACTLVAAVSELPVAEREALIGSMRRIAGEIAARHGEPCFGCCHDCRHFRDGEDCPNFCDQVGSPVKIEEQHLLCADFEAADPPR
jgi:DNA-binding MarR family transcriptional regulator